MTEVTFSDIELRAVIRFFCLNGKSNREILAQLHATYGPTCIQLRTVETWAARFRAGRSSLEDDPRSGRPPDDTAAEHVLLHLEEDPHMSIRSAASELGICKEHVRLILERNGLRFVTTRWVPNTLTAETKSRRVDVSGELLEAIEGMSERQLSRVITSDESWFYHDNPHEGRWLREGEQPDQAPSRTISSPKSMVVIFWNFSGFKLVVALEDGQRCNSQLTVSLLHRLDAMIRRKRPKMGLRGMWLHWDNARPHFSATTRDALDDLKLRILPHPPYSPDIAPSDFFLFGYLKEMLKGRKFAGRVELEDAITVLMDNIPKEVLENVKDAWIERLRRVIELEGEYYTK